MTVKYAKETFLMIKGLENWENYVCWLPGSGIVRDITCTTLTCRHVSKLLLFSFILQEHVYCSLYIALQIMLATCTCNIKKDKYKS